MTTLTRNCCARVTGRIEHEPELIPTILLGESCTPICFLLLEVDINGDGMMEWDEFTRFVVVKAQLHHAQMSIDQLAEYRQGSRQVGIDLGEKVK